jgi:acylphosphatase
MTGRAMTTDRTAARVRVTGRVQGVYFRAWTRTEAGKLGLDGWVRNENDGSVTVLLAGPRKNLDAMIAILHRGPPEAVVSKVVVEDADPAEVPAGFRIVG